MTLKKEEFQILLFRTAFCLMACDGTIHEKEINEMKAMDKSAAYFQGIDLSKELENLLEVLKEKGKFIVDELFDKLKSTKLTYIQELLILEIALRLIYADENIDENEINFLRYLRSKLEVPNEIIRDRFGTVEYLFDKDYSKEIVKQKTRDELLDSIKIPEYYILKNFDYSKFIEDTKKS